MYSSKTWKKKNQFLFITIHDNMKSGKEEINNLLEDVFFFNKLFEYVAVALLMYFGIVCGVEGII
jgi:hypothetical protein